MTSVTELAHRLATLEERLTKVEDALDALHTEMAAAAATRIAARNVTRREHRETEDHIAHIETALGDELSRIETNVGVLAQIVQSFSHEVRALRADLPDVIAKAVSSLLSRKK